jgi:hypothetical protein
MGIQRLRLASPRAQRLPSSADFVELSRSRNPHRGPERQRGLWSFLTWPFILAPIAAAETFGPQHGHTNLTDEQDDSSARQGHANTPVLQDGIATGAPTVVNEQPQEDATDASRVVGASRGTFQNGNSLEENHGAPPSGVAETANSGAGGGGGGGGGGSPDAPSETQSLSNDASQSAADTELPHTSGQSLDQISKATQPDTLLSSALDHVEPASGAATGALGSELSTIVSATSDEISNVIQPDTLVASALDHVEPSIGAATSAPGSDLSTIVSTTSDEISKAIPLGTLASSAIDHVEPSIGAATSAPGSELSTIVGATSDEISNVIQPDTLVSSALDHVEPPTGAVTAALGLESSTIENGTPIGLPSAGEDTPINLKDVLGFDLHVNPGSGAIATEAALAPPGTSLSHSIGDLGFVTTMPSADSIGDRPPGISHEVDDLFAAGQGASDLQNLGNATSQNQMGLAKAATPAADLGIEGISSDLAAGTTSPATPVVQTVGEATDITPGHSLELSTPPSSAGDALFQGTNYTDYHMALQTGVSAVVGTTSESVVGTPSESASVPAITALPVEQPSVTHVDSSAVTQPPQQAAAEPQDLTTLHSLSVHIH